MTVDESVMLCRREIAEIFETGGANPLPKAAFVDTGKYGEILGKCPVCGSNVVRGKQNYGCMGFANGCEFKIGISICKKTITKQDVMYLLANGKTQLMRGFISKTGKTFEGFLIIKDGAVVFDFPERPKVNYNKGGYKKPSQDGGKQDEKNGGASS
jgi:DNA topoisomerase-3